MPHRSALHRDGIAGSGLSLECVTFTRGGRSIVRDVSFDLAPGRLLVVLGPSGAGKSTLLSLIAGFERPDRGLVRIPGASMDRQATASVGMSFDDAALHEHLSIRENLDSAAAPRGEPRERRHARVRAMAESLGIEPLLDRMPSTLSAGERRRVSVGRAFIRSPEVALLDEPFANLDRGNRFTIRQMVRELQRSTGSITIVVTHDAADALAIADDLLVLIDGRVRAFGDAAEVSSRPPDLEVAQLVDELGMHAVELDASGGSAGCVVPEAIRVAAPGLLGIRPWHVRPGAGPGDALRIRARVLAREPAGIFTDLIATRADGRTLRARMATPLAQDLPIGVESEFHVPREDVHLFAGPWPGVRMSAVSPPISR